jgi:hypothetical protein
MSGNVRPAKKQGVVPERLDVVPTDAPSIHSVPVVPDFVTATYVDGRRAFTIDDLARVRWNSKTGSVAILDDSGADR